MDVLEQRAITLWRTFPPFLLVFGTFGNVLTVFVLMQARNRKSSTSMYLTALAVSDFLVLWTGLIRQWIKYTFDIDIRALSVFGCKLHLFLIYDAFLCSSWFLVAVTVERFISVWFPHKVRAFCSPRNAGAVIAIILVCLLLPNLHWFYGVTLNKKTSNNSQQEFACGLTNNSSYSKFFALYEWIYLCVFSLIPLAIISLANVLIILKLLGRKFKTRIQVAPNIGLVVTRRDKVSQLTVMLLTVNTVFIICTPPLSIYNIWEDDWKERAQTDHDEAVIKVWWAVVNMLAYLNTTLNFFLYFLSGPKFRNQVKDFFCRRRNITGTLSTSQHTNQYP